jgi:cbb3-type cytochrome c oxidase subunit II
MRSNAAQDTGWQGASLVAITYVYFLIFAQFAFLRRMAELGIAGAHLRGVMAAMAIGGVLVSLTAPRERRWASPSLRLRCGFAVAGTAAVLTLFQFGLIAALAISLLIGASLGLITVTLVTHLRRWTGSRNALFCVGIGTGIGYFVCNIPVFFNSSVQLQALAAGFLCLMGIVIAPCSSSSPVETAKKTEQHTYSFLHVVACFTALVWFDSAAFFIIQNTPELKAGTWQGSIQLWSNGLLHLAAALASAWLLRRRGLQLVLTSAFIALGLACLCLLNPHLFMVASILYPIGVSLYSVALVAYPSLLSSASSAEERGRQAGWIYAIAGWFGSAMGIGMGQNLGYVPPIFVLAAGAVFLLPRLVEILRRRVRELALTAVVALAALFFYCTLDGDNSLNRLSQVERGRRVYISEGCIHCHSQYVRPNSPDVLMWGPVETMEEIRRQNPPLIGNRRQGPDLSQVGIRRSALWLKAHFYDPAEVSGASIMPSFALLFHDGRGDDLVAYLANLHGEKTGQHLAEERLWRPAPDAVREADAALGKRLYEQDCATCHSAGGRTRIAWHSSFKRIPSDLGNGPFVDVPLTDPPEQRRNRLAQIVKFGIPGTDMPGHEYLADREIASLALWLSQSIAQPQQQP